MKIVCVLGLLVVAPVWAQSASPLASLAASPTEAREPRELKRARVQGEALGQSGSARPSRASKLQQAREETRERYATRRTEAVKTLASLRAVVTRMREGRARREVEKAITNLESGLLKADGQAASGVFRKAFVLLGRPAKAAQAALKRCQGGTRGAGGRDTE